MNIQSNYLDIEPTSPCPIVLKASPTLGRENIDCFTALADSVGVRAHDISHGKRASVLIDSAILVSQDLKVDNGCLAM